MVRLAPTGRRKLTELHREIKYSLVLGRTNGLGVASDVIGLIISSQCVNARSDVRVLPGIVQRQTGERTPVEVANVTVDMTVNIDISRTVNVLLGTYRSSETIFVKTKYIAVNEREMKLD